jgi:CRP-like cAMP-binding protein
MPEFVDNGCFTCSVERHLIQPQGARMDAGIPALLKRLSFSAGLPAAVQAKLAKLAERRAFLPDEVVFREGSPHEHLLILVSGRLVLEMYVPGRGNVHILTLGPGDLVAWSTAVGNGHMTASGRALEATEVLAIQARDLLAECEADPALGYSVMRQVALALANRLVATRLQLLDVFADPPATSPSGTPS